MISKLKVRQAQYWLLLTNTLTPLESNRGVPAKKSWTISTSAFVVSNSSRSNLRNTAANVKYNSAYAKFIPRHIRDPRPKGTWYFFDGTPDSATPGSQRSGRKSSGSGKMVGFIFTMETVMLTAVPGGMVQCWNCSERPGATRGLRRTMVLATRRPSVMIAVRYGRCSSWANSVLVGTSEPSGMTSCSSCFRVWRTSGFARIWYAVVLNTWAVVIVPAPMRVMPSSIIRVIDFSSAGISLYINSWKIVRYSPACFSSTLLSLISACTCPSIFCKKSK